MEEYQKIQEYEGFSPRKQLGCLIYAFVFGTLIALPLISMKINERKSQGLDTKIGITIPAETTQPAKAN